MNAQPIPEDALERGEPYGPGCWGYLDMRRKAIRDATREMEFSLPERPELGPLVSHARVIGQQITQKLWHLLTSLEEHESGQRHIQDELHETDEALAQLKDQLETLLTSSRRRAVEQLRSHLGREAREGIRKWLEARAEAEEKIAEQHAELVDLLVKIELATGQPVARPDFATLFKFLHEPPRSEVLILDSEVNA